MMRCLCAQAADGGERDRKTGAGGRQMDHKWISKKVTEQKWSEKDELKVPGIKREEHIFSLR